MGTLFKQRPRKDYLTEEILVSNGLKIKNVADKLKISFDEAIQLYLAIAKIHDYDVKDEQLAGFGEIFLSLIDKLDETISIMLSTT